MAAIRCAAAGRALLRRSPGLLRRASAGVGERGLLGHPTGAGALAPSSNRYMSCFLYTEYERKKLAVELMKERSTGTTEIEKMDELLGLLNDNDATSDQVARQVAASRREIEDKKHELVSLLLRADNGMMMDLDHSKKMEELILLVRRHRESLVLEDLKARCTSVEDLQAKMIVGLFFWGIPLTLVTMLAQSH